MLKPSGYGDDFIAEKNEIRALREDCFSSPERCIENANSIKIVYRLHENDPLLILNKDKFTTSECSIYGIDLISPSLKILKNLKKDNLLPGGEILSPDSEKRTKLSFYYSQFELKKQPKKGKSNMQNKPDLFTQISKYTNEYGESGWEGAKDGSSYAAANYLTNTAVTYFGQFVPGIDVFNKTEIGHTVLVIAIPFLIGVISIWSPNTFAMVGLSTEQIQEISKRSCRAAVSHRVAPLFEGFGAAMSDSLKKAASSLSVEVKETKTS